MACLDVTTYTAKRCQQIALNSNKSPRLSQAEMKEGGCMQGVAAYEGDL